VIALLACAGLTLAVAVYIFFPAKKVAVQSEKSRLEYLGERKAVLYDNLRDLNFEHRAGKYRDEDYATERTALEGEAADVVAEMNTIDMLEQPSAKQPNTRKA